MCWWRAQTLTVLPPRLVETIRNRLERLRQGCVKAALVGHYTIQLLASPHHFGGACGGWANCCRSRPRDKGQQQSVLKSRIAIHQGRGHSCCVCRVCDALSQPTCPLAHLRRWKVRGGS